MTGVILVAKPNKLFQVSHQIDKSNENLTKYFTGVCLALTAAFCGALIGITTKVLKGKKKSFTGLFTVIWKEKVQVMRLYPTQAEKLLLPELSSGKLFKVGFQGYT